MLARLDLVTGEYRIVKQDERLMGVSEEKTLQLESYCEQLVAEKAIHPEDAAQFRAQAKLELLQAALFRERRSVIRRFRQMVAGECCPAKTAARKTPGLWWSRGKNFPRNNGFIKALCSGAGGLLCCLAAKSKAKIKIS